MAPSRSTGQTRSHTDHDGLRLHGLRLQAPNFNSAGPDPLMEDQVRSESLLICRTQSTGGAIGTRNDFMAVGGVTRNGRSHSYHRVTTTFVTVTGQRPQSVGPMVEDRKVLTSLSRATSNGPAIVPIVVWQSNRHSLGKSAPSRSRTNRSKTCCPGFSSDEWKSGSSS